VHRCEAGASSRGSRSARGTQAAQGPAQSACYRWGEGRRGSAGRRRRGPAELGGCGARAHAEAALNGGPGPGGSARRERALGDGLCRACLGCSRVALASSVLLCSASSEPARQWGKGATGAKQAGGQAAGVFAAEMLGARAHIMGTSRAGAHRVRGGAPRPNGVRRGRAGPARGRGALPRGGAWGYRWPRSHRRGGPASWQGPGGGGGSGCRAGPQRPYVGQRGRGVIGGS
jgi:hypothetical protein